MAANVENLSQEEKISLVKGMGNWHTNDLGGKIPSIHLSDGPHGLRAQSESAKSNNDSIVATCFPTASALACSFDRELVGQVAGAIATQAKETGVSVVLGPGVNIKRSPVCGRNFEYFSEDPYLAGELAGSYVISMQESGIGTSLKHFAANSQETHRMTANSMVDERTLREIYLRAFEKVVKNAKPATIMASYNLLNGMPACENKWLLSDVLRREWGYEGLVMSDWGACVDAGACLEAGMDLEMPDSRGNHRENIMESLQVGILSEQALDRAAENVMTLVKCYKQGNPGLNSISQSTLQKHRLLAEKVSAQCAVLLRNEAVLPLQAPKKVCIIGELAEKMRVQGGGSSHIHTEKLTNIPEAFREEGIESVYFPGYSCDGKIGTENAGPERKKRAEAIQGIKDYLAGQENLPILVFGGLTDNAEGEGYDREVFTLPENQRRLFQEIKNITENVIYISFGGSPYDLSDISFAKAILSMYLGGEGTAKACVSLLLGKENPSGRLAETWPMSISSAPCFDHFGQQNETLDDVAYMEGLFVGYRFYDTFQQKVRYPFGFGLSYSRFSYENLRVEQTINGTLVRVNVTNTIDRIGKETVMVFVHPSKNEIIRAKRELRGFSKIEIAPGETKNVEIRLDERSFEVFDVNCGKFVTVSGEYQVEVSRAVGDVILSETIQVDGVELPSQKESYPSYFPKKEKETTEAEDGLNRGAGHRFSMEEFKKLYGIELSHFSDVLPGEFTAKNSLIQMAPYSIKAKFLMQVGKVATKMMTGAPLDDPESRMMYEGITEGNIDSVCNQSGGVVSKKMIEGIIASANRGKRRKRYDK